MRAVAATALGGVGLLVGTVLAGSALLFDASNSRAFACGTDDDPCPPPSPTISVAVTSMSPGSTPTGDDVPPTCMFNGAEIPCTSPQGVWYAPRACYVSEVPRGLWPPAGDPVYGGKDPSTGSVWWCNPPNFTGVTEMIFIDVGDPPLVDPVVLVWAAIVEMNLQPISMGSAPSRDGNSMGLIGLPTWMWVRAPTGNTYGPITVSESDGPVSITATAKVTSVDWSMGDGAVVTCTAAGTPYDPSFGDEDSPDCGYRYQLSSAAESGGRYSVTATSHWEIAWNASTGASGVIRVERSASTRIRIGEMQVLVQ